MQLRTSFRTKLLLLTIAPLAIAQLVTLVAVMQTVQSDVRERARESLVIGANVVNEYLAARAEQLRSSVTVLASDFGLKEAAASGDRATIISVLENHSRRVGAQMAMLIDLDGQSIASTLSGSLEETGPVLDLIKSSPESEFESTVAVADDSYHVFVVPLRAPVPVGYVVIGFRIDDSLAIKLADLTGLNVTIVAEDLPTTKVIATTDERLAAAGNLGRLTRRPGNSDLVYTVDIPEEQSLTIVSRFVASAPIFVVLQRSLHDAMLPYVEARSGLLMFAAVLLLLVAAASGVLSSTVAKPLRSLAGAAQRMISGDYDSAVNIQSKDEFGELARSFDSMRLAIAEREQRISHQALHHSLTDLPNRENVRLQLAGALDAAKTGCSSVVVLSIRLARMDEISSTIGHDAADELIALAARHLQVNLQAGDCLGHTASNEFVIILNDHDVNDARAAADQITAILDSGIALDRVTISLCAHIGIAEYPSHGHTPDELLRYASIARTDALQNGDPVCVYQPGREEQFNYRLRVVNDLRSAIVGGELQVWYQPKAHLPAGVICGAEALVRWHHPEFGFLSPDDFIPAAEKAGTIMHLTRFVLREAIRECRAWQEADQPLAVSVNLATRDLLDEYLPYHVLQLLKEHDLPASRLTLEITETSIMQNLNQAMLVLECLRDMGVSVSMDDFGTGHSSLAQLRAIPLNELKIDKSFIMTLSEDFQDQAIVRNTIELAHSMNLRVVAEGVEDEATMRRLAEMGCEQAQGYFLCRPIPSVEVLDWLNAYEPINYAERRGSDRAFG